MLRFLAMKSALGIGLSRRLSAVIFGLMFGTLVTSVLAAQRPGVPPTPGTESESTGWIGVVLPLESVLVAARVRGVLEAVGVRAGDAVEKGDLLARIEDDETVQSLRIAVADLEVAHARHERERVRAERESSRHERRATTAELWSEEELATSKVELETAKSQVRAAAAEVERAQAAVEQLQRRLASLEIRAPFAGHVSVRHLDPGAVVSPGTPIVRLVSGSARLVRFAVPPDDSRQPTHEDTVAVFDTGGRSLGTARVRHVAPEIDLASQQIFVEAILVEATLSREPRGGLGVEVRPSSAPSSGDSPP